MSEHWKGYAVTQPPEIVIKPKKMTANRKRALGIPVAGGKPSQGTKKDKRIKKNRKKGK